MARLPRLCIPGLPHLVLQRGHGRGHVFEDDADRALFRELLRDACQRHAVQVHAYSLQSAQVLLLATPSSTDGLGKVMQDIGRRYVAAFNRRHARSGGLWAGRFRATVIEPERYLLACMRWVEGLAAGLAGSDRPAWSSAPHHLGGQVDPVITEPREFWALGNTPFDREAAYRQLVQRALTQSETSAIKDAAETGWPLGSSDFVVGLGQQTNRRVTRGVRGRPKRT